MSAKAHIGVTDSGVGGLTFVREIKRLCPGVDITYIGDSANCPYGNRSREELTALLEKLLRFLESRGVHGATVACNTTSPLLEEFQPRFPFPLFGIIKPIASAVAKSGLNRVGVFATEFTAASGEYQRLIQAESPAIEVFSKGSPKLAALVDRCASREELELEISTELGALLAREPLKQVILACTHFPIVEDCFTRRFPQVEFLNPAVEQAAAVAAWLEKTGLDTAGKGRLDIRTTGDTAPYYSILKQLEIEPADSLERITL